MAKSKPDFDAERYELEKGWRNWLKALDDEMSQQIKVSPGMFLREWLPAALIVPGESREMTEGENETNG